MPPPVPPMVKDGRMIAGRPISSSARSASGRFLVWIERGVSRPILVMASRNSWRSSALSIASAVAPIISTSYLASVPHLAQRQRAVQRGLAAHGRQQREAAGNDVALLLDDLGDDLGRDRLDIGGVRQSGSVMIVAGLELTRTIGSPRPSAPCRPGCPE
jgi:hypothetical protein